MPAPMFKRVVEEFDHEKELLHRINLPRGHFYCHHITFTPTRTILEGPNPTQSNRVIRTYQEIDPAFTENFIRVDFRDEDRYDISPPLNIDFSVLKRAAGSPTAGIVTLTVSVSAVLLPQ